MRVRTGMVGLLGAAALAGAADGVGVDGLGDRVLHEGGVHAAYRRIRVPSVTWGRQASARCGLPPPAYVLAAAARRPSSARTSRSPSAPAAIAATIAVAANITVCSPTASDSGPTSA